MAQCTPKSFDLTGKVALITGASYGIGMAIAKAMAANGATIVFNDIKQELWIRVSLLTQKQGYTPIPAGEEGLQVEVGFIGGVTPKFSAYLPVQPFCGGLGKTVGEGLEQEGGIVVSVPTQELYAPLYLVSGGDGE